VTGVQTCALPISRKDGLKYIEENFPQTELIILDDGFQHRWIKPAYSILLTKYSNPFSSDFLLPFGNLRESAKNSKRANAVIITKTNSSSSNTDLEYWRNKLKLGNNQLLFFSTLVYKDELLSLNSDNKISIQELRNSTIVLITSIASNLELVNYLENNSNQVIKWEFPDHYAYTESDIIKIKLHFQKFKEKNLIGITTAKDSAKLKKLENIKSLDFDFFVIQSNVSIIGQNKDIELINQINKIC
jgi:tetraacyldisaccharide 4'-kinase